MQILQLSLLGALLSVAAAAPVPAGSTVIMSQNFHAPRSDTARALAALRKTATNTHHDVRARGEDLLDSLAAVDPRAVQPETVAEAVAEAKREAKASPEPEAEAKAKASAAVGPIFAAAARAAPAQAYKEASAAAAAAKREAEAAPAPAAAPRLTPGAKAVAEQNMKADMQAAARRDAEPLTESRAVPEVLVGFVARHRAEKSLVEERDGIDSAERSAATIPRVWGY